MGEPVIQANKAQTATDKSKDSTRRAITPEPDVTVWPLSNETAFEGPTLVIPSREKLASNRNSRHPVIFVNGMNMIVASIEAASIALSLQSGAPVLAIPNATEGAIKDLRNCLVGTQSDRGGLKVEAKTAMPLLEQLTTRASSDTDPIELVGYSQGTIILSNSLWAMHSKMSKNEWNTFAARTSIKTYGPATSAFPPGIEVTTYEHAEDGVAISSPVFASSRNIRSVLQGKIPNRGKRVRIPLNEKVGLPNFGEAHDFLNYMKNTGRFFWAERNAMSVKEQVSSLKEGVLSGELSDESFQTVAQTIEAPFGEAEPNYEEFQAQKHSKFLATELLKQYPPQGLGAFEFTSKTLSVLRGVASAELGEEPPRPRQSHIDRKQRPGKGFYRR